MASPLAKSTRVRGGRVPSASRRAVLSPRGTLKRCTYSGSIRGSFSVVSAATSVAKTAFCRVFQDIHFYPHIIQEFYKFQPLRRTKRFFIYLFSELPICTGNERYFEIPQIADNEPANSLQNFAKSYKIINVAKFANCSLQRGSSRA